MTKPTVEDVDRLIQTLKYLLRSTEWTPKISRKKPTRWYFESACTIGTSDTSNVLFRAEYRPASTITKGQSVIELCDVIYVGLFVGEHRVCAMDTNPSQTHTNVVGIGLPYYRQVIKSLTHMHIWTEVGEGYVEPVEPPITDIEELFENFFRRVNLVLKDKFVHPLRGQNLEITGTWTASN